MGITVNLKLNQLLEHAPREHYSPSKQMFFTTTVINVSFSVNINTN